MNEITSVTDSEHDSIKSKEIVQTCLIPDRLPPRIEELRLTDIALELPGKSIVSISQGRGQAAATLAKQRPDATVRLWYIDGFAWHLSLQHNAIDTDENKKFTVLCQPDWPVGDCDLVLLPLRKNGEAELTRDLVQSAYDGLVIGGRLVASVDHGKDRWLHELLKTYEKSVKVRSFDDATVYIVEKSAPLKKRKQFQCDLSFKDCDEVIQLVTRPGVFSHRELDNGAKQLLDAVDVFPDARLIDIGCGAGPVALALAARDPSASIHAIDANSRAVYCTRAGVERNGLDNVTVALNYDGNYSDEEAFDMALANPPYFADFAIAEHFLNTAYRSLRPGGRVVLVTNNPSGTKKICRIDGLTSKSMNRNVITLHPV